MTGTVASTAPILSHGPDGRHRRPARYGGRAIWAVENRVLDRTILGSKHLLREPPAIAFDAHEYSRLRPQFDMIMVRDRESGLVYSLTADEFDRLRQRLDRGHGLQFYVELCHWQVTFAEGGQLGFDLKTAPGGVHDGPSQAGAPSRGGAA